MTRIHFPQASLTVPLFPSSNAREPLLALGLEAFGPLFGGRCAELFGGFKSCLDIFNVGPIEEFINLDVRRTIVFLDRAREHIIIMLRNKNSWQCWHKE